MSPPTYTYRGVRHLELIAEHLDAVKAGQIDRLAIFMPPRHAKTETSTIRFPVFALESDPTKRCLITGYNERVARRFSRKARNLAEQRIALATDKTGADEWETIEGGGVVARGVGTPPTGFGFDYILIDDPIKKREEAESEVYREKVWDWYTDDLYTRLEPNGAIILTLCMTGDTPVLMADGTERPLRDIKTGDLVATYDNGKLGTSTVRNHKNNHRDFVYKITMISGRIVRANERHPFLVEEQGQLKWIRLKNLTTAHKIVTVKDSGASGKARHVPPLTAKSLSVVGAIAPRTTAKSSGLTGIVPRHATRNRAAASSLSIAMELPLLSMTQCSRRKMESVLFASYLLAIMFERIGAESYALTTATIPLESGRSCATTATSLWDTPSRKQPHSPLLSTSDFTSEQIESIEFDGVEDVFDVQIDRTENFIANGLVSHNTRWHHDDLAARALASEPGKWTILKLPALAEEDDPLGRAVGAALWPARFPESALQRIKDVQTKSDGAYSWEALYQQNPTPREGAFFKVAGLKIVNALPTGLRFCRGWDLAASVDGKRTAGVKIGIAPDGQIIVADVRKGQWLPDERDDQIRQTAALDGTGCTIRLPQDPGQAGVDQAQRMSRMLGGYMVKVERVIGSKEVRAGGFAAQVNVDNVKLLAGDWNRDFIEELRQFPQGKFSDQVDASSDAYNEVALRGEAYQDKWRR